MKTGDIVIVTAKLDDRIKDADPEDAIGTVVQLTSNEAWVLLKNGNLWIGDVRMIYPHE